MEEVVNVHDKYFKDMFGKKDNARAFFSSYLPPEVLKHLDLESIEIVKESFIEKDLKEYFSDILYKVNLSEESAYIYLLFEHKSYSDRLTALQLLEYMVKIWRLHLKQNPLAEGLPIILPLVLYHGTQKWKHGTRLSSLLSGPVESFMDYIPDFQFLLYDLSSYRDEDIRGMILLRVGLLVMKHIFSEDLPEVLVKVMELLAELSDKTRALEYIETIIRYVVNASEALSLKDLKKIIKESYFEKKEGELMTIAEQLRMEGHQSGLEKGHVEATRESVFDNLEVRFGVTPEDITQKLKSIDNLSVLRQLRKKAIVVKSLDEFREILNKSC